jgi:hypothetical protein
MGGLRVTTPPQLPLRGKDHGLTGVVDEDGAQGAARLSCAVCDRGGVHLVPSRPGLADLTPLSPQTA